MDDQEISKVKEENKNKESLNPIYNGKYNRVLDAAIFSSLFFLLSKINYLDRDLEYIEGILKHDIGPVKSGTNVKLYNKGEIVKILVECSPDEIIGDDVYKKVYKFRLILQAPIIVEDKNKI